MQKSNRSFMQYVSKSRNLAGGSAALRGSEPQTPVIGSHKSLAITPLSRIPGSSPKTNVFIAVCYNDIWRLASNTSIVHMTITYGAGLCGQALTFQLRHVKNSESKKSPEVLCQFFLNGWEFFDQILLAYCTFPSTLD